MNKVLFKKAVKVFNAWIRERDKNKGCISCITGGVHNAGHLYHGHLYSALQFNEINVNGQCIHCNLSKAGNEIGYRQGIVRRYGQSALDLLGMAARQRKTWNDFELEFIINHYGNRDNKTTL